MKQKIYQVIHDWNAHLQEYMASHLVEFTYQYSIEETSDGVLLIVPNWSIDENYPPSPAAILDPKKIRNISTSHSMLLVTLKNGTRYDLHGLEPIWNEKKGRYIWEG